MKLQDPMKHHPPFDVAAGAVQMYLDKGYTKVEPPCPPEKPQGASPKLWPV